MVKTLAAKLQIVFLKALVRLTFVLDSAEQSMERTMDNLNAFDHDRAYFTGYHSGVSAVWGVLNKLAVVESLTREQAHAQLTETRAMMERAFKLLNAQDAAGLGANGEYDLDGVRDVFTMLHKPSCAREYLEGRHAGFTYAQRYIFDHGDGLAI